MRLLVAVAAALFVVSANAKVVECRLPSLKDQLETVESLRVEALKEAVKVIHYASYPKINYQRSGPRSVLYRNDTSVEGTTVTFLAIEGEYEGVALPPYLITVNWGLGKVRTSSAVSGEWEERWFCKRMD